MAGVSNFSLSDFKSLFFWAQVFLTFGSFQIRQCCLDQPAHSRRCRQAPPRTGPRLHRGLHWSLRHCCRANAVLDYVFLVLTQAFTKDKPSAILFYFHKSLVHNMFRLAPWSHGILLTTDEKIINHKRRQLWWQLSLSLTKFIVVDHKRRWKRLKTFTPQGLFSLLPLLPGFPSPPLSSDPSLPS